MAAEQLGEVLRANRVEPTARAREAKRHRVAALELSVAVAREEEGAVRVAQQLAAKVVSRTASPDVARDDIGDVDRLVGKVRQRRVARRAYEDQALALHL